MDTFTCFVSQRDGLAPPLFCNHIVLSSAFKGCLLPAPSSFPLPRLSLLFRMGLPSPKQALYSCLPSLWNVVATDDSPTLL